MKILVVDDDRTLSDLVAFTLRREGYEILQAFDGEAALTRWMISSILRSRRDIRVSAMPVRPARPVRPIRWT